MLCEIAGSTRASDLVEGTGVDTLAIDPQHALEEWLARQVPRRLVPVLARSGAFAGFVGAAPGARELVTITKAWELGEAHRWRRDAVPYDTVVLDAPGLRARRRAAAHAAHVRRHRAVGPIAGQARLVAEALRRPGPHRARGRRAARRAGGDRDAGAGGARCTTASGAGSTRSSSTACGRGA